MAKKRVKVTLGGANAMQSIMRNAEIGMVEGAIIGDAHAAYLTPVDTSNLLTSQVSPTAFHVKQFVIQVISGYTAKYAVYVHDPDIRQNFKRKSAKKRFLAVGHEEAQDMKTAQLLKRLK